MHVGIDDGETEKDSKTEILFAAARPHVYSNPATFDDADLSNVLLPNGRFFSIVSEFKYLGSYLSRFGNDVIDVDSRIASAGKAFSALRGCLFASTHINVAAKRTVYEVLILNILLYGGESWSVTAAMQQRLRVFYASSTRGAFAACAV